MRIYSGPTERLAKKAAEAQLFEVGGYLGKELDFAIKRPAGRILSLATVNREPVGVAIATLNKQIMVYVQPEHRRKRVGYRLVARLVEASQLPASAFWAMWGNEIAVTSYFWGKCRIELPAIRSPTL